MNNAKSYFITYLGFGVGLISLSFLAIGWDKTSLITLGVAFVLTAVLSFSSLRFRPRWLVTVTEHIGKMCVSHFAIFLIMYGLAITLIQNDLVLAGIIFVFTAYIALGLGIGRELGSEVLRPLLTKLNW